jgi:hypothetical protein
LVVRPGFREVYAHKVGADERGEKSEAALGVERSCRSDALQSDFIALYISRFALRASVLRRHGRDLGH